MALTVAGSDSGGGAGVQADLKAFAALRVHGTCAVTAVTAQNTRGVEAVHAIPPEVVAAQIACVLGDFDVRAAKIGMLGRAAVASAVARALAGFPGPIVLDPVLVAKGGAALLEDDAVAVLREELLPLARLVTPNLPEAARLCERSEADVLRDPEGACRALVERGARDVLLKGGHAEGSECSDLWWNGGRAVWLRAERIATANTHGTGCTLSAAIAAGLAAGLAPEAAIRGAKDYVTAAIRAAARQRLGAGHGPVHHMHAWWAADD